jgi:hypothetical protein
LFEKPGFDLRVFFCALGFVVDGAGRSVVGPAVESSQSATQVLTEKEKHEHDCGQRKSILPVRESSHYLPPIDFVPSDPFTQVL